MAIIVEKGVLKLILYKMFIKLINYILIQIEINMIKKQTFDTSIKQIATRVIQ